MPVTHERLDELIATMADGVCSDFQASKHAQETCVACFFSRDEHDTLVALRELRARRAQERALWVAYAERWGDAVAERLERVQIYDELWVYQAARSAAHFGRLALGWTEETKGDDA